MKKYVALFVLATIALIAFKAPVSLLQEHFPEYQLSGKVINGSAHNPQVGLITFSFLPTKLFTGKLAYELIITKNNNNITTVAAMDIFGDIVITDTNGLFNLDYIKQLNIANIADIAPLKMVDANIQINDLFLIIEDKISVMPSALEGNFDIFEANILGEKVGSYNAVATLDSNGNSVNITSNPAAIFDIDAVISLIDEKITVRGEIAGKDKTSVQLINTFGIDNTLDYQFKL